MSVFDHEQESGRGGMGRVLLIGAGVVALLVAGYFGVTMMMPEKAVPKEAAPPVRREPDGGEQCAQYSATAASCHYVARSPP